MKIMRKARTIITAVSILLLTPLTVWCQQDNSASGDVLTLEQAIALALSDNHLVKNAELGVGKVENELAATRTFRLPSIHLYMLASQQLVKHETNINNPLSNIIPGLGPFFSISAPRRPTAIFAGQVLQPLSQQYRIGLNIKQVSLSRDVEREELRLRKQTTIDEVKRTYYAILQTQSALESLQESIRLYRELDRVTGDYVAQQVALKSDSLEVKTRLAKTEYEALNLTNQLATKKEQLNNLIGRDVRNDFRVSAVADVNDVGFDLASARNRALDQRPELRAAKLKVSQAEVDRRIKKSEYIPDVSVGFTYMSFRNFNQVVPKNSASIGVVVKWEVFD